MASNINAVAVTGNLTKDPESRIVGDGFTIGNLRIAVNTREKSGGEWSDYASYFDVTVFGGLAENCVKYLEKGKPIAVQGYIKQERWEKDGAERSKVVIIANAVQFLESRGERQREGDTSHTAQSDPTGEYAGLVGKDDDIPF